MPDPSTAAMPLLLLALAALLSAASALVVARRPRRLFARPERGSLRNPSQQVAAVAAVRFVVTPLLDAEEASLLAVIEAALSELAPDHRVLARVSLDEVVRPLADHGGDWDRAVASIRSKRLDFAIFDAQGRIVAALGCPERARALGAARDRVRRDTLARAGVPYVVLTTPVRVEPLCQALDAALGAPACPLAPAA